MQPSRVYVRRHGCVFLSRPVDRHRYAQKGALPMPGTQTEDIKSAARQLVDSLPDDATWDDVMYRVYVRQAIDAGRQDVAEGRLVDVEEVRRQFGLPE
jgi:hypothetical protein